MILTKSLGEFKKAFESLPDKESIGFVPTMGALHEGHLSLVQSARKKCRHVIVSVFVNPTQFNNKQDLATYPRTLDADAALLEKEGADILFAPQVEDIYPEEGMVTLSRRLMQGKSVSRINGETVTTGLLKEAASILIDIHGQHDNQTLLNRKNHLVPKWIGRFFTQCYLAFGGHDFCLARAI